MLQPVHLLIQCWQLSTSWGPVKAHLAPDVGCPRIGAPASEMGDSSGHYLLMVDSCRHIKVHADALKSVQGACLSSFS